MCISELYSKKIVLGTSNNEILKYHDDKKKILKNRSTIATEPKSEW